MNKVPVIQIGLNLKDSLYSDDKNMSPSHPTFQRKCLQGFGHNKVSKLDLHFYIYILTRLSFIFFQSLKWLVVCPAGQNNGMLTLTARNKTKRYVMSLKHYNSRPEKRCEPGSHNFVKNVQILDQDDESCCFYFFFTCLRYLACMNLNIQLTTTISSS